MGPRSEPLPCIHATAVADAPTIPRPDRRRSAAGCRASGDDTGGVHPDSSKNARSYQSAVPLAVATGVNIQIDEASPMNSFTQGQRLRQSLHAAGERVVLFWEHRRMPELARGLGWEAMPEIANDDVDQLILFRFAAPAAVPAVKRYSQRELFQRPCYRQASPLVPAGLFTPPNTASSPSQS